LSLNAEKMVIGTQAEPRLAHKKVSRAALPKGSKLVYVNTKI